MTDTFAFAFAVGRADGLALGVDREAVFRGHCAGRHFAGLFVFAVIRGLGIGVVQHKTLAVGHRDMGLLGEILSVQENFRVFVA